MTRVLVQYVFLFSISVGTTHSYHRFPPKSSRPKKVLPSEETAKANGEYSYRSFLPRLLRTRSRWDALELVRVLRGGDMSLEWNSRDHPGDSKLDRFIRSISLWSAVVVFCQSFATFIRYHQNLIDEIADRLLSAESAAAVKMIRQILQHFQDHGIVDVMKQYPTKTVVLAIVALSKLQRAASVFEEGSDLPQLQIERDLIRRLAHYSVYASAAYGWTMEAALRGRLHMGNLQALLKTTGIEPEDVIKSAWESKTHRPAFFIVRDKKYRKVVLAIRGTLSPRDLLTDLCAAAESFETDCPGNHRAHQGMLKAARCVADETANIIDAELRANPDFSLVLVGHSLGGGVASVLGTLWEGKYPDLAVFSYGSPCVGPIDARPTTCQNMFSIIAEGDPFSCLSLGHIANLSRAIAILCEDDELRNLINLQTDRSPDRMDVNDLQWCSDTMKSLRSNLTNECLYPPGRTIIVKREFDSSVSMYEAPVSKFTDLRLHGRMLDISRHVPSIYESLLKDYLSQ